jgi:hypothetical protein
MIKHKSLVLGFLLLLPVGASAGQEEGRLWPEIQPRHAG